MAVEVIKEGRFSKKYIKECKSCGAIFTFKISDLLYNVDIQGHYMCCPECNHKEIYDINKLEEYDVSKEEKILIDNSNALKCLVDFCAENKCGVCDTCEHSYYDYENDIACSQEDKCKKNNSFLNYLPTNPLTDKSRHWIEYETAKEQKQ